MEPVENVTTESESPKTEKKSFVAHLIEADRRLSTCPGISRRFVFHNPTSCQTLQLTE